MEELPALEDNEFGQTLCRARGYLNQSALHARYAGVTPDLLFPGDRKPDVPPPPLPGVDSPNPAGLEYGYRAAMYWHRARCDIQIAGPKTVRLFHAYKDKLFISVELDYVRAWYYDKNFKPIKNPPPIPDRELRIGKLPADFTEHFAVYTNRGRDYMVTDKGKLYLATPKGKAEVEVTELWKDPQAQDRRRCGRSGERRRVRLGVCGQQRFRRSVLREV